MADVKHQSDGPRPSSPDAFDYTQLPDYDNDFVDPRDFEEFANALAAPENHPSQDDLTAPPQPTAFITALNDWRPVRQRVRGRKRSRRPKPGRGKDETREGYVYSLLKWPLLVYALGWLAVLGFFYAATRLYVSFYEYLFAWRGRRRRLRQVLRKCNTYEEWVKAAADLDAYLGNDAWKREEEYAYYDSRTIRNVKHNLAKLRARAEKEEDAGTNNKDGQPAIEDLRGLVETCVKNNFAGIENPHLYSETYCGTKNLVQGYVDEVEACLGLISRSRRLTQEDKRALFKHLSNNFGRTALCLSGGATFAYYHFGVAKAMLDAGLLPDVITGTSGGALVAALLGTRTDEELKKLLVPALANRLTACHDDVLTWAVRWWRTGARFDSVDWAQRCSWFSRGSMTFREAYDRTGRVLNVSCVPSDPYSPTILANYLTSPDCVIWSAVLASAAVPGILNPVVLMKKTKDGRLAPYSFGHKWKDGSLRTDIPLKALNLHFNVNFSIVSQVNPHINLFFFSSRGTVGRPVTHRRGRGWRGGFLGSALEQYMKLEMTKWLKVLRHLELLPRPLGQNWSEIWLQRFSGTITIWPMSVPSDFYYILSDPSPARLARMIHVGQQSTFPKLRFIANRMAIEKRIEQGRRATRPVDASGLAQILSDEDLHGLLAQIRKRDDKFVAPYPLSGDSSGYSSPREDVPAPRNAARAFAGPDSPSISKRLTGWWGKLAPSPTFGRTSSGEAASNGGPGQGSAAPRRSRASLSPANGERPVSMFEVPSTRAAQFYGPVRRGSFIQEIKRQSRVFVDDYDDEFEHAGIDSDEDDAGRAHEGPLGKEKADTDRNENTIVDDIMRAARNGVDNKGKARVDKMQ